MKFTTGTILKTLEFISKHLPNRARTKQIIKDREEVEETKKLAEHSPSDIRGIIRESIQKNAGLKAFNHAEKVNIKKYENIIKYIELRSNKLVKLPKRSAAALVNRFKYDEQFILNKDHRTNYKLCYFILCLTLFYIPFYLFMTEKRGSIDFHETYTAVISCAFSIYCIPDILYYNLARKVNKANYSGNT